MCISVYFRNTGGGPDVRGHVLAGRSTRPPSWKGDGSVKSSETHSFNSETHSVIDSENMSEKRLCYESLRIRDSSLSRSLSSLSSSSSSSSSGLWGQPRPPPPSGFVTRGRSDARNDSRRSDVLNENDLRNDPLKDARWNNSGSSTTSSSQSNTLMAAGELDMEEMQMQMDAGVGVGVGVGVETRVHRRTDRYSPPQYRGEPSGEAVSSVALLRQSRPHQLHQQQQQQPHVMDRGRLEHEHARQQRRGDKGEEFHQEAQGRSAAPVVEVESAAAKRRQSSRTAVDSGYERYCGLCSERLYDDDGKRSDWLRSLLFRDGFIV